MISFVIMTGCSNSEKNDEFIFIATVLETNETHLLVEPLEGSSELNSADKIIVSVRDANLLNSQDTEITISDIEAGMQVEITYNGEIAESYPAQINGLYRVRISAHSPPVINK